MLMMGNALFFQDPTLALLPSLRALLDTGLSIDELRARVRSTTSDTTQALLGATTPINKTWQVGADVRLTDVGEILPVAVILPSGQGRSRNVAIGGQLIGTNLYSQRDTHVLSATVLHGTNYSLTDPVSASRYAGGLLSYNNSSQVSETLLLETVAQALPAGSDRRRGARRAGHPVCVSPTACSSRSRSSPN